MTEQPLNPPDGPPPYSGYVTFACPLGKMLIEVEGRVSDDELLPDTISATWQGIDVAPLLDHFDGLAAVCDHFDLYRSDILHFDPD